MPKIDNSLFYQSAIKKYGISAKGVHWSSKENQEKRFEILISFLKDINQLTIADAGCGFGDLYLYLNKITKLPKKYIGIDIDEKMVQISKYRTKQQILHLDILNQDLPKADYYIASGSLNILTPDEAYKFIEKLYNASTKGVVFNALKIEDIKNKDIYNGFNPFDLFSYCVSKGSNNSLKDGYLKGDFTIFMQK